MNKRIKKPKTDEDWMLQYTATLLQHIFNLSKQENMDGGRFLFAVRFLGRNINKIGLGFKPSAGQLSSAFKFWGVFDGHPTLEAKALLKELKKRKGKAK